MFKLVSMLITAITITICPIPSSGVPEFDINNGLFLKAHNTSPEHRTSLDLSADHSFNFHDGFTLGFDIKFRREEHNYGYIFRLICNDGLNMDMISNLGWNTQLLVVLKEDILLSLENMDEVPGFAEGKWVRISITLDAEQKSITVDLNGNINMIHAALPDLNNVKIVFGRNSHKHFVTTDVAPMSIRNVTINSLNGRNLYSWPLSRHGNGFVLDELDCKAASVSNGIWENDRHIRWTKAFEFEMEGDIPQLIHHETGDDILLYAASGKQLYRYSLNDNSLDSIDVVYGQPYVSSANSLVYDTNRSRLVSYTVENDELNSYDFATHRWSADNGQSFFSFLHHNKAFISGRDEIIVYGGYDHYHYNGSLFIHGGVNGKWRRIDLSEDIEPRYLSAMARAGDSKLFILGGYGSKSGRQEEFPAHYFDLHEIDLDNMSVKKTWSFESSEMEVFGNRMIIDSVGSRIYALSFPNDRASSFVRLNSFGFETPDRRILADSIPFAFHDTRSYATLVHDGKGGKLIAVLIPDTGSGKSKIEVHTLLWPPMATSDVLQSAPPAKKHSYIIWIVSSALVLLLACTVWWLYHRRRKKAGGSPPAVENNKENISAVSQVEKKSPSILFFGGFRVLDTSGTDITGLFSQTIRSMLVYVLINQCRNGSGVTSKQLDEIFWSDMDKTAATNNRNVTMSKLRMLLKKVAGSNISSRNGLWNVSLGEGVYFDYGEMYALLSDIKKNRHFTPDMLKRMAVLGAGGQMLPCIGEEWLDKLKSDYMFLVSDVMTRVYEDPAIKNNLPLLVRLSDLMLGYDPLDEEAIRHKCHALYHLGKTGLAMQCYEAFRVQYEKVLAAYPNLEFKDIIGGEG